MDEFLTLDERKVNSAAVLPSLPSLGRAVQGPTSLGATTQAGSESPNSYEREPRAERLPVRSARPLMKSLARRQGASSPRVEPIRSAPMSVFSPNCMLVKLIHPLGPTRVSR